MADRHARPARPGRPVRLALPDALVAPVRTALQQLDPDLDLAPWQAAHHEDILIVAPHEYSQARLDQMLGAVNWSWVHLTSAGVDFVDLRSWPSDRLLTRSWQCYAAPLAQYAVGAMLAHEWRRGSPWTDPAAAEGAGLWGARIAVAGWGEVGKRVAAVSRALGASVIVMSLTPKDSHGGVQHTTRLADILGADHLVIALPADASTIGMFGRQVLGRMRHGLHLINVSRAGLVDQAALASRCAEGLLFATLDVTDPEPLPASHYLRTIPAVRISPHIGWRSRGSDAAFTDDFGAIWRALASRFPVIPGSIGGYGTDRASAAVLGASSGPRAELTGGQPRPA